MTNSTTFIIQNILKCVFCQLLDAGFFNHSYSRAALLWSGYWSVPRWSFIHYFTPSGKLEHPIHLLSCFRKWEETGEPRGLPMQQANIMPTRTWAQKQTENLGARRWHSLCAAPTCFLWAHILTTNSQQSHQLYKNQPRVIFQRYQLNP